MAWTNPKTWSVGETLTAANFNAHIRDNFLAMGPHLVVRKTADESDTTLTFQNDDALLMSVAANEVWYIRLLAIVFAGAAVDFTCRWTWPASATFPNSFYHATAGGIETNRESQTASPGSSNTYNTHGTADDTILGEGIYRGAGTAGTVNFQWTNGAAGTATVRANSTLWAVKLA